MHFGIFDEWKEVHKMKIELEILFLWIFQKSRKSLVESLFNSNPESKRIWICKQNNKILLKLSHQKLSCNDNPFTGVISQNESIRIRTFSDFDCRIYIRCEFKFWQGLVWLLRWHVSFCVNGPTYSRWTLSSTLFTKQLIS